MLFDLQIGLSALARGNYDVCVCGSGPAGITVARELAAGGKRVALLEAGGLEFTEQSQSHYAGTESGISTFDIAVKHGRLRYFGGTSNHWSGMCGIFSESDFWSRRYHELPGWPIARSEVLAHLPAACEILDLGTTDFSSKPLGAPGRDAFAHVGIALSPPTRFGTKYRKEIVESSGIDLFINANLVDLHLDRSPGVRQRIDHVLVSNYRGETAKLVARQYVLALGSIENARMLLSANKQLPVGIGNHSDFVGRCYMEHLNVGIGRFVTRAGQTMINDGTNLTAREPTLLRLNVGAGILSLGTNAKPRESGRLGPVRGVLRKAACDVETVRDFARRFKDFTCAGDGVISSLIEQAPDRNNRVTLRDEVDDFGLRRAHVHWVLSDADRRTVRALGLELAKELVALDAARVQLSAFITDTSKDIPVLSHAHQMGTTRMAADPRLGVVDANCQVHGVGNLYMAGSSVFPTGGGINPTLTIVMLSLRLAKHLRATT
jgi:choline dehydrogenase-like flavoprotein